VALTLALAACDAPDPTTIEVAATPSSPEASLSVLGKTDIPRTVGLTLKETGQRGYLLYSPFRRTDVFLVDMNGKLVHTWQTSLVPGASAQLTQDGTLLRAARTGCAVHANPFCTDPGEPPAFASDGRGGTVQEFDWDGNLLQEFVLATPTDRQHHEVIKLPNGNWLMNVWTQKDGAAQTAAGRNPGNLIATGSPAGMWSERIIEVDPQSQSIVWEWRVWDHLVQDFDNSKPNFDNPADRPERFDINVGNANSWLHINSLDYNAELDQILFSANGWSEIFIIDHSTTTAEAAGSTGGNSGKGGDILFRWGNSGNHGGTAARQNFNQHNAKWVVTDQGGAGDISFFHNNGQGGPPFVAASEAVRIRPVVNDDGSYGWDPATGSYLPAGATARWTVPANQGSSFVSSAQVLSNGDFFVTAGFGGRSWLATKQGDIKWAYRNPADNVCPVNCAPNGEYFIEQGHQPSAGTGNLLFRALLYEEGHPGLAGRDLTPGYPVEAPPLTYLQMAYDELGVLAGVANGRTAAGLQASQDAVAAAQGAGDYAGLLQAVGEALRTLKRHDRFEGVPQVIDWLQYVEDWNRPNQD
jgi:hypothetical protein